MRFNKSRNKNISGITLECKPSPSPIIALDLVTSLKMSYVCVQSVSKLSSVYQHVDDVDLFVGGLLEKPKPGSLLGHTFLCIVGDQFARLKVASFPDRN